ncbi:MAG: hypothetical protein NT149_05085 [Candidatus Gottesmanbacteria bacterium]|nr:hypothetical protein [Candidatus Gottesmanbacteria bacterium]
MISHEVLERLQAITQSPEFLKLSVHEQILYLRDQGIDFIQVSGWGTPTLPQQEAIDKGASHSIAEPKMDGQQPRPK